MADEADLLRRIHSLADLDLAALLCLISREHCIVTTEPPELDDLVSELRLVASRTFGLSSAVVDCTPQTTLEELVASIQIQPRYPSPAPPTPSGLNPAARSSSSSSSPPEYTLQRRGTDASRLHGGQQQQYAHHRQNSRNSTHFGNSATAAAASSSRHQTTPPQIANVILAKNLDRAPRVVQIQCLELLRTRRILTRTSVQTAPKQFLFVAVLAGDGPESEAEPASSHAAARLVNHLNDFFYIAHWHDPEDGFAHLEEEEQEQEQEQDGARAEKAAMAARSGEGGSEDAEDHDDDYESMDEADSASSVVVRRSVAEMSVLTKTPTLQTSRSRSNTNTETDAQQQRPSKPAYAHTTTDPGPSSPLTPPFASPPPSYPFAYPSPPPPGPFSSSPPPPPLLPESAITLLSQRACAVATDVDVLRYQHNVVAFLRLHRAVFPAAAASASPLAARHLGRLSACLAALHGLDFVTPALVALATRKTFPHRLRLAPAARERSLQWGSDPAAAAAVLAGLAPDDVLDDVLAAVAPPL
ncbi:hypothetical protein GGS23DRAFT_616165 [Durotheca rogersii]|uniref:uncharacterized protein n=1 Tax=Durotheca rogersii TaxID=419775 RepID=UPI002220D3AC|nr:uncharacterized protein GGS23DRAFT_616165 [Durotheca rogersii]KAI5859480.1 hypothetical protein GGS23DRAFT_616165 [Durotheca rogersii]